MTENRESFFKRLEPFLAPSELLEVQLAYTMAKFAHRAQQRKELDENGHALRYFEHVRRVAITLMDEGDIMDHRMVIAALLHDGIEDTRDRTPEMIQHCFGTDVTRMVKVLSKERFHTAADWRTYAIKMCDRIDNLRSLSAEGVTKEFKQKQLAETEDIYIPLFEESLELVPPLHKSRVKILLGKVKAAYNIQYRLHHF